MTKQELIEKYELELKDVQLKFGASFKTKVYEELLDYLKQLDEPQKVTIPQFVADWYEEHKDDFEYEVWDWISSKDEPEKIQSEFALWVNDVENNPIQTLVNMHQFGYEVEQEKRYRVKMKDIVPGSAYLKHDAEDNYWYFGTDSEKGSLVTKHTEKELKGAGFGWVFGCPGIEIEEVEE